MIHNSEIENDQNYQNDTSQVSEYDEGIKNNFEMSIASIGDLYYKNGTNERPQSHQINRKINKITINSSNLQGINGNSTNKDNTLEISKLKPSKNSENK